MKRIILILAAAAFISGVNAQVKFGNKIAWSFANFDITTNTGEQLKTSNITSWDLGITAQIPLSGIFYLQPELLYASQKVTLSEEGIPELLELMSGTSKMAYFQIPVNLMLKYDLKVVKIFAEGGAYFGFAIDRNEYSTSQTKLRKTDWGMSLGAGLEIWKLQLNARYNWALANLSELNSIKWKNNRFNIAVTFFY